MAHSSSMPDSPATIPLWSGDAPGSEGWDQVEQEALIAPALKVIRNVTHPTLTVYLPDRAVATGAAVVICPGGAFHFLSIDMEGTDVATWLTEHGVAGFVLRYRLLRTGDDFPNEVWETMRDGATMAGRRRSLRPLVLADGQQAIRLVRQGATQWGLRPERIGMMGFSAGGTVTESVAVEHDAESRPDFVGVIYGAGRDNLSVPDDAPPLFALCASDDAMATPNSIRLYSQWRESGHPAELHIYASGGHGFGMRKQGLPSDHWIERFADWLQAQGYLKQP